MSQPRREPLSAHAFIMAILGPRRSAAAILVALACATAASVAEARLSTAEAAYWNTHALGIVQTDQKPVSAPGPAPGPADGILDTSSYHLTEQRPLRVVGRAAAPRAASGVLVVPAGPRCVAPSSQLSAPQLALPSTEPCKRTHP